MLLFLNNVNVENENEKISSKQNNSPQVQVQVQQQTNNISLQNNSETTKSDLLKFIQVFENKKWYWKMKAAKNYKIHDNLLNLYFEHKSQIEMLKGELNNPESIQLAKSATKSIWGKELLLNLQLTNSNNEVENKSNKIDDNELFLSEASKYGKLISLKEIKNES